MSGAPLGSAIPTLPARDLDLTAGFYGSLGFSERGRWDGEYLIAVRDTLELHFFEDRAVDPYTTIAGCYLRVADAPALWEEWSTTGVPIAHRGIPRLQGPPSVTDYGLLEFALIDPDGNLLRVGSLAAA